MLPFPRGQSKHATFPQRLAPTKARPPPLRQRSLWHSWAKERHALSIFQRMEPWAFFFPHLNTPKGSTHSHQCRHSLGRWRALVWEKSTIENHWGITLHSAKYHQLSEKGKPKEQINHTDVQSPKSLKQPLRLTKHTFIQNHTGCIVTPDYAAWPHTKFTVRSGGVVWLKITHKSAHHLWLSYHAWCLIKISIKRGLWWVRDNVPS